MAQRPTGAVHYDNARRVVVVTGGSQGIGQAVCERFHETGAVVITIDVDLEAAKSLPAEIDFIAGDVTRKEDCQMAVDHAVEKYGAIDVLVNNAAVQPVDVFVPVHQLSEETWRRVLEVNVTGYTLMAQVVIPVMLEQQGGVIVNLASAHAHQSSRDAPAYGPAKGANLIQTKQWGLQYAREGIRVVSVSPGAIDTPLVRSSLEQQGGSAELANRHPLGRLGNPREVAAAVLWLSSNEASCVTAADFPIDGGLGGFGAFADPYPPTP